MYFLLFLLLALLTAAVIALLHRFQLKNRTEIVDRTAPLTTVDLSFGDPVDTAAPSPPPAEAMPDVPVFTAATPPAPSTDNWQEQVKQLREAGNDEAAVALCREHFPRIQAFQQAAIIMRQLLRTHLEANRSVVHEMKELYRIAVMADLYRNSNPVKPVDALRTLQQLQQRDFDYNAIGTRHLRLLTKSDIRHLEQMWGRPRQHAHAEDCSELAWPDLCR
jgi:hypothetical protein